MLHAAFPPEQRARYARQLVLREIGPEGQARLAEASVLVIGAGGLGGPVLAYLVGAGVGRVTVMDPGTVSRSDLPRQLLYRDGDVGRSKAEVIGACLAALNPHATVEARAEAFAPQGGREAVRGQDLVIDASDNPATRYLASDACVLEGARLLLGAVVRLDGQVARLAGGSAPCYRCLHPEPPEPDEVASCAEVGVLGPAAGAIAGLLATEALRTLATPTRPWTGWLLHADLAEPRFLHLTPSRDPSCAACGPHGTVRALRLEPGALRSGEPYPGPAPGTSDA